jgi:hypothetical protein
MSEELPAPLVAPDVDCSDLDSFMLNAERLMSSELLALHGNEIVGAAILLWCRAWKQKPAATEIKRLVSGLQNNDQMAVSDDELNAALAAVDGARPENETAAMLASQMALTHSLAMDLLGRTRRAEMIAQFDSAGSLAVKLLQTFTAQVEALAKLKRGGEQVVRVEHVHVYPGGQAIVGTVTNQRGEGGVADGKWRQADGASDARALSFAPGPRCLARTRSGTPCQKAAAAGKKRCRMHGGAPGSGAPRGERNGNYRTGLHTSEAIAGRRMIRALIKGFQGALS